ATVVSCLGLAFVAASLLSLIRLRQLRWATVRDGLFLVGLAVTFALQLSAALDVTSRPGDARSVGELAILVTVCFFIGIARAWELIGGPSIGISYEVVALVRGKEPAADGAKERAADGGEERAADDTHAAGAPEPPGGHPAAPPALKATRELA